VQIRCLLLIVPGRGLLLQGEAGKLASDCKCAGYWQMELICTKLSIQQITVIGHLGFTQDFPQITCQTLGRRVRHSGKAKYAGFRRVREDFRSANWPEFRSRIVNFWMLHSTQNHAKTGSGLILSRCATECRQLSFHNQLPSRARQSEVPGRWAWTKAIARVFSGSSNRRRKIGSTGIAASMR